MHARSVIKGSLAEVQASFLLLKTRLAKPGMMKAMSHGNWPSRGLLSGTPVLCKQACTRDWGMGRAQHAIQHTKPHPMLCCWPVARASTVGCFEDHAASVLGDLAQLLMLLTNSESISISWKVRGSPCSEWHGRGTQACSGSVSAEACP